jgi:hypothetical protein
LTCVSGAASAVQ